MTLPDSTDELGGQTGHLFDSSFLFNLSRDDEGTETITVKLPGKAGRMLHDILATRRVPMSNMSELVRAAIGHMLHHMAEHLNDPAMHMTWLWLEQAARAAVYVKEAEQVVQIVDNLARGLRVSLERADPEMAQDMLERFFAPVMSAKEYDRPRTKMLVRAALEDMTVGRAVDWVRKSSEVVQEAYEYGKED